MDRKVLFLSVELPEQGQKALKLKPGKYGRSFPFQGSELLREYGVHQLHHSLQCIQELQKKPEHETVLQGYKFL